MADPRRVLMLTLRYPPSLATGTIRTLKFQKYLPDFGWIGDVVTGPTAGQISPIAVEAAAEGPGRTMRLRFFDPLSAADRLEAAEGRTTRSRRFAAQNLRRFGRYLLVPDGQAFFARSAMRRAGNLVADHDVVFATGMPWSALVAAVAVRSSTELPVVLDLRDPWIEGDGVRYGSFRNRIERRLEAWTLSRASAITVTCDGLRREICRRLPDLAERVFTIPNGYDEDDFASFPAPDPRHLTVVHTGNFYGSKGPAPLLEGIAAWLNRHPARRDELRVRLIGRARPSDRAAVAAAGLDSVVNFEGPFAHRDAVRALGEADILVAVDYGPEQSRTRTLSKMFEYLRAGAPIVFLSTGGATDDVLVGVERAATAPRDEPVAIADALERAALRSGRTRAAEADPATRRFERRVLTGALSELLSRVKLGSPSAASSGNAARPHSTTEHRGPST